MKLSQWQTLKAVYSICTERFARECCDIMAWVFIAAINHSINLIQWSSFYRKLIIGSRLQKYVKIWGKVLQLHMCAIARYDPFSPWYFIKREASPFQTYGFLLKKESRIISRVKDKIFLGNIRCPQNYWTQLLVPMPDSAMLGAESNEFAYLSYMRGVKLYELIHPTNFAK